MVSLWEPLWHGSSHLVGRFRRCPVLRNPQNATFTAPLELVTRDSMVSVYLVEHCHGSSVVARIEAMGLVHSRISDHEIALRRVTSQSRVGGTLASDPQRAAHSRRGAATAIRDAFVPRETLGNDRLVVETGVDPVTSRFSGARSTN